MPVYFELRENAKCKFDERRLNCKKEMASSVKVMSITPLKNREGETCLRKNHCDD